MKDEKLAEYADAAAEITTYRARLQDLERVIERGLGTFVEVGKALATDGGAAILNLTPTEQLSLIGPWNLPETGYGNVIGS